MVKTYKPTSLDRLAVIHGPSQKEGMMSNLFWLTEEQIRRLQPFFPKAWGRARVDDRGVLSGIIFVSRNGLRQSDAQRRHRAGALPCDEAGA